MEHTRKGTHYVSFGRNTVLLDGDFTVADLEEIVAHLRLIQPLKMESVEVERPAPDEWIIKGRCE